MEHGVVAAIEQERYSVAVFGHFFDELGYKGP